MQRDRQKGNLIMSRSAGNISLIVNRPAKTTPAANGSFDFRATVVAKAQTENSFVLPECDPNTHHPSPEHEHALVFL